MSPLETGTLARAAMNLESGKLNWSLAEGNRGSFSPKWLSDGCSGLREAWRLRWIQQLIEAQHPAFSVKVEGEGGAGVVYDLCHES